MEFLIAVVTGVSKFYFKVVEELKEALRAARSEIEALRQQQATSQANLQSSDCNKQLGSRERESLLKLVGGMAIYGYGYDPRQLRNDATSVIRDDLLALGLSLDEDTVRKYLKQGTEMVPRDVLEIVKPKPNSGQR